jgi:hypothetical protein
MQIPANKKYSRGIAANCSKIVDDVNRGNLNNDSNRREQISYS